jgi:multidrug efflux pump subunit AcrB
MAAITAELPIGVEVTQIADQPKIVEHSVSEFVETFIEALGIVLLVSFLSLGWRAGIVVALSVPLVLAIVLTIMYAAGIDLHRITLGALIIALGLLVDDAIIAIEMMVVKMEQGWDRTRAATFAWTSTAFPMLTGTLVTAAGFLPVGFAKSSAGEYAGGIFWIVGLALIASWIVAVRGFGRDRGNGGAGRGDDGHATADQVGHKALGLQKTPSSRFIKTQIADAAPAGSGICRKLGSL